MSLSEASLLAAWNWKPSVVIGVAILVGAYLAAIGPWRVHFPGSTPVSRTQIVGYVIGALIIL